MKLYEFEGKKLLRRYGISIPRGFLCILPKLPQGLPYSPLVLKAQTLSGERKKEGGIMLVSDGRTAEVSLRNLLGKTLQGEMVKKVLAEEHVSAAKEYYISLSYDTDTRGPILGLSTCGGSGISEARLFPIDITRGVPDFFLRSALYESKFPAEDIRGIAETIKKLWTLFINEYALLAEINPLFKTAEGKFVAGDAKIILDDEKINPGERRFLDMDGDIAILASGGGASLLNIDTLLHYGGRPANYTEYSGNPPAEVVKNLTKRVLKKRGLKGCWVVGGTANFTDIYETMRGFVEGLREVKPRPRYPIVIRRDGPRQKEAFAMLRQATENEGYNLHLYDSETPMSATARVMVKLAYDKPR